MSILGNRVLRREDPKFLTTGGIYVDDLRDERLAGAAHVTFVRSTMAHARIVSVDTSEAVDAPGVVAILTADDVGLPAVPRLFLLNQEVKRAPLASGVVRFVGEPVVAVGSTPVRAAVVEEAVATGASPADAAAADQGAPPAGDLNASEEFRRHLARVLVRRGLEEAGA